MSESDKSAGAARLVRSDSPGRVSYTAEQREAALEEFDPGCLSGLEFSRVYGVKYQTFAPSRQRRQPESREGGYEQSREQSTMLIEATRLESHRAVG